MVWLGLGDSDQAGAARGRFGDSDRQSRAGPKNETKWLRDRYGNVRKTLPGLYVVVGDPLQCHSNSLCRFLQAGTNFGINPSTVTLTLVTVYQSTLSLVSHHLAPSWIYIYIIDIKDITSNISKEEFPLITYLNSMQIKCYGYKTLLQRIYSKIHT